MIQTKVPAIYVDGFGFMPGNYRQIVRRYTMINKHNAIVKLISLGAGIQSIIIPNRNEDMADIVLGFDDVAGYLNNRYIGRIVEGSVNPFCRTTLKRSSLAKRSSSDIVNWDSHLLGDRVVMTHLSRDDAGHLFIQVTYSWSDDNKLRIEMRAASTTPRHVELNSCCLFNLAGHGMGPEQLHQHVLTVNAGDDARTLNSPFQLSTRKLFRVPGNGFDHNLKVYDLGGLWSYRFHGRILHPPSNRTLEVYSNHPTLRVYTGNYLPDPQKINPPDLDDHEYNVDEIFQGERGIEGKDGMLYTRYGCFALMPQGLTNIVDGKKECSNVLYPGKIYVHDVTYDFGVFD